MSHVVEKPPSSKQPTGNPISRVYGLAIQFVNRQLEASATRKQERLAKLKLQRQLRRQKIQERRRNSWLGKLRERLFVVLDYDPTDIYSGDAGAPTLRGAIAQWFYRVFWTRRIELTGFVLLCTIGWFCYHAVSQKTTTKQIIDIDATATSSETDSSSSSILSLKTDKSSI